MNGMEEFLVDPVALTEDPLHGLPGEKHRHGRAYRERPKFTLSAKPFMFERFLNEWSRASANSGKYRVAVLKPKSQSIIRSSRRPVGDGLSNILAIDIVPAPAAWVKEQIAEAYCHNFGWAGD